MSKVELTPNTHKGKLIVFEGTDGEKVRKQGSGGKKDHHYN